MDGHSPPNGDPPSDEARLRAHLHAVRLEASIVFGRLQLAILKAEHGESNSELLDDLRIALAAMHRLMSLFGWDRTPL